MAGIDWPPAACVIGSEGSAMTGRLSARLRAIADALPLRPGMRVLEIGCGPGAAAKAVLDRLGEGHLLGVDRSERAIAQAGAALSREIAAGRLSLRHAAIENFELAEGEPPYDLAFAIRVGALDGRHPEVGDRAMLRIAAALAPGGRLFIDGGDPLRELPLPPVRKAC
jgi:cyclopropane fatty-acyl-phospholipid synthase-like methyltransferase